MRVEPEEHTVSMELAEPPGGTEITEGVSEVEMLGVELTAAREIVPLKPLTLVTVIVEV